MSDSISETKTGQRAIKGVALLVIATSLLALGDSLAKHLTNNLPAIQILWARFLFFFIPLFFMIGPGKIKFIAKESNTNLQFLRAFLAVVSAASMIIALKYIPLGTATAILFTSPILVTILSSLILKERINPQNILSVIVGFAGVLMIANPFNSAVSWHLLLPLTTAFCFATYQIVTRILSRNSKASYTLLQTGFFGTIIATLVVPFHWAWPSYNEWLFLVAAGLLHGLAHFMMIQAFSLTASSLLAPFLYFQLVSAMAFGYLLFNEVPSLLTIFGTFLIVTSGIYILIVKNA